MRTVFFVAGIPVPKGSARAFLHSKTKRVVTQQDNAEKQKPWASAIGYAAHLEGLKPVDGAVSISMDFTMPRPKSHYRTGKRSFELRDGAPIYHTTKPDLDKLQRCVLDALTGIAWNDDCQVSTVFIARKCYGEQPGVWITIENINEEDAKCH